MSLRGSGQTTRTEGGLSRREASGQQGEDQRHDGDVEGAGGEAGEGDHGTLRNRFRRASKVCASRASDLGLAARPRRRPTVSRAGVLGIEIGRAGGVEHGGAAAQASAGPSLPQQLGGEGRVRTRRGAGRRSRGGLRRVMGFGGGGRIRRHEGAAGGAALAGAPVSVTPAFDRWRRSDGRRGTDRPRHWPVSRLSRSRRSRISSISRRISARVSSPPRGAAGVTSPAGAASPPARA